MGQPAMGQVMAPSAGVVQFDPHYQNIEETIDAMERRINQERVRYNKLIANRELYEQWMGPEACGGLINEASMRMGRFDPNFDAEPLPLPRPWLRPQQQHPSSYSSGCQSCCCH